MLSAVGQAIFSRAKGMVSSCTRAGLLEALVGSGLIPARDKLAALSCWIHRVAPGLRVL